MTTRCLWSPRRKWAPAAWPIRCAIAAVIGIWLVRPLIPSVPKNLRFIARCSPLVFAPDSAARTKGRGLRIAAAALRLRPMSQPTRILLALIFGIAAGIGSVALGAAFSSAAVAVAEPIGGLWLNALQ